jgi:hypothetical protein
MHLRAVRAFIEKLLGDLATKLCCLLLHQLLLFLQRHSKQLLSFPLDAGLAHHAKAAHHRNGLNWHSILAFNACQIEDCGLLGLSISCTSHSSEILVVHGYTVVEHIVYF